jgi:hypothetical protein
MDVCKKNIPHRTVKIRPMDKPWITHEVKKALKVRNRLYKRYQRSRLLEHENSWKHSAIQANFKINQAKLAHKEKIRNLLMTTSIGEKKYWKIAKQVYESEKGHGNSFPGSK